MKRGRFVTVLITFFALGVSGCTINPVTGHRELALTQVSPQEEIALGEKAFPRAVQQMGGEYTNPALNAYVQRVGEKLAQVSHRPDLPYRFKIINDSTPNAFALPGGFIAITRGLLTQIDNEAELAAVLGHEIGHVTARHSVEGMERSTLLTLGLAVLSGVTGESSYGPLVEQAGQVGATLLDRRYSREQERESDRLGIDYMVRTGYDPRGAVQLQELFYQKIEGGAEPAWVKGIFSTHPFSRERMVDNERYIQTEYPRASGGPATFGAEPFQQASAGLRQVKPAYDLYDRARELERQGKTRDAVATYLEAAAAAPEEPAILTGLGMAYLRAEEPRSARPHLAKAVKLNGDYYLPRLGLGYIYLQQENPREALTQVEASMKLLPTIQGAFLMAEAYEKTGEPGKAAELYTAVAQADPQGKLGQAAAARLRNLTGRP